MIVAVGLDIIELTRIAKVWQRHPQRFLDRHFTAEEIAYCLRKSQPVASLAARFAVKEAFQKCWPHSHGWKDVWTERKGVKPQLGFAPLIAQAMQDQQLRAHLSLSHSRDHAAAMVVLEHIAFASAAMKTTSG